jgi:hypothetical protein
MFDQWPLHQVAAFSGLCGGWGARFCGSKILGYFCLIRTAASRARTADYPRVLAQCLFERKQAGASDWSERMMMQGMGC